MVFIGKKIIFMNTQIIKMTESDLHKIVTESVNKVLTELDWRTYASAAKKGMLKFSNLE